MPSATLRCHPASPSAAVRCIEVDARLSAADELSLAFDVQGDLSRVSVPTAGAPVRADRLWEHTCFEAFVGAPGSVYFELDCSPAGSWNLYRFDDYRSGMHPADAEPPVTTLRRNGHRLELGVTLALGALTELQAAERLAVGLAAVIEAADGTRSYWALTHCAAKPDFHVRAGFALGLERPAHVVRETAR